MFSAVADVATLQLQQQHRDKVHSALERSFSSPVMFYVDDDEELESTTETESTEYSFGRQR